MENQPTNFNVAYSNKKKKSHVPKFGDWDSENISYTACFENARKDGVRRNPNDPEENPEAFKAMLDSSIGQTPYYATSSSSKSLTEKMQRPSTASHILNEYKISVGSRQSNTSDCSDNSNSDYAFLQHRRERSDRKKSLASSGSDKSISRSQLRKPKSTSSNDHSSNLNHDTHTRVASIPKFGEWDEKDPQSGEGFTYIFEQVKEEKKTTTMFPAIPHEATSHSTSAYQRGKSHSKLKSWCCLF